MIDIKELSDRVPKREHYIGQDGMKHCKVCNEPLELLITVGGKERKVNCVCSCTEREEKEKAESERKARIERNRTICFSGSKLKTHTFATSKETTHTIKAKNYCKNFEELKRQGVGLLMYGGVGTGKSHLAACIGNELIEQGYTVLMTNFATIVNHLQSKFDGRQEYIDNLSRYDLLILDDLGAERSTEFMNEQIFQIVNSRYVSGLPMIVTTNLTSEQIVKTADITTSRIMDRLIEKCHPFKFEGQSIRRNVLQNSHSKVEAILNGNE